MANIESINDAVNRVRTILDRGNSPWMSDNEIEDLIAKAVKKPSSEVDLDAIEKGEELKEVSTGAATVLALPVLLELASKLSNKIYQCAWMVSA